MGYFYIYLCEINSQIRNLENVQENGMKHSIMSAVGIASELIAYWVNLHIQQKKTPERKKNHPKITAIFMLKSTTTTRRCEKYFEYSIDHCNVHSHLLPELNSSFHETHYNVYLVQFFMVLNSHLRGELEFFLCILVIMITLLE